MTQGLKISVIPGEGEPFQRTLPAGAAVVVGRSSEVDLMVPDRMLSRRHARFYLDGPDWFVEDLGSHNGTFLNGARVQSPSRLKDGDVLALGGSTLTVSAVSASAPPSPVEATHTGSASGATIFRPATEVLRRGAEDHGSGRETDKEALRASLERLKVLNQVHQALARSISLNELMDLILDRAFGSLHPEEGAIYLRRKDGEYACAASRSTRPSAAAVTVPRSLVREVGEKGMAALVLDVQADDRFAAAASMLSAGVRSLVAAPLQDAQGVVGIIALASTLAVRQFTEEDMELLVSLGAVAALRIRNVALTEEAAEAKRLEQELALARRIQLALLPDRLPEIPGYEVHGGNLPSRGVSGDYYEVLKRKEGAEAVLWIVDVCGKGMSAALLTASLEALAAGLLEEGLGVDEIFRRVSRLLYQRTPPEKYATAFMAAIETATGKVAFTNAGHCPSLLVRADGSFHWLEATGIPLGLMEEWAYARHETAMAPGDLLMLYTDGITEAMDPSDEEFGTDRLAAAVSAHRGDPLKDLARALEAEMDAFAKGVPYADDRTLVLLRRQA